MKKLKLIGALLGVTLMGVGAANAAPGYVTANLNMRSGPDLDFPSVEIIPEGTAIEVAGCLPDESWCDVIAGSNRGWVYGEYLAFEQGKEYVLLPDAGIATFKIPTVHFVAEDYWTKYYVGRPWYAQKAKWVAFAPRPRLGWQAPPGGVRKAGWWRSGYKAPEVNLVIPVERWKRRH